MSFLDGDIELGDVAAGQTLAAGGHAARHTEVKDALEEIRDGWPTKADQADLDAALVGEGNVPVPTEKGQQLVSTGSSLGDHTWRRPLAVDVRAFGAVGDGVADDTAAIQAAVDFAQTLVTGSTAAPDVYFAPGAYRITSQLTAKSASWIGGTQNVGVRILWDAAGGTAVRKDTVLAGGVAFWRLENLNFRSKVGGAGNPDIWLDLRGRSVDIGFRLRELHFASCNLSAIRMDSFYNCHWEHLRFDNHGEYAIHMTPTNYLGSFNLDGFTYDNGITAPAGKGFMHVDLSAGSVSVLGPVEIANGRIELNAAWSSPKAVVVISQASSANSGSVPVLLRNIGFQDVVSTGADYVFYRDTSNTSATESVTVLNSHFDGLAAVWGGALSSTQRQPALVNGDSWSAAVYADRNHIGFSTARIYDALTVDGQAKAGSYRVRKADLSDDLLELVEGYAGTAYVKNRLGGANETWAVFNTSGTSAVGPFEKGIRFLAALDLIHSTNKVRARAELQVDGTFNHDGTAVGFFNSTPVTKPTVSGSRGGNAALASLITALANLGLVTDSTTA